ncbi:unnamed protein product [marine sediment metagenome]|uniref:Uncharacterized protein n=1 Tax=marine sediment metagenome TaxID=412755 RepID=X1Q057_9ZZZZ
MNKKVEKKMTEELTGQELIKTFLESTYIHYTAAEIYEFFEESKDELKNQLKISTIRKYLQELSVRDEIVELSIIGKRDKYYIAKSGEETLYLNMELIGLYIHHYDSTKLLDCINERKKIKGVRETPLPQNDTIQDFYQTPIELNGEEMEMDRKMLEKISFFEGITMMNYHDIPKIVGINTFQRHKDHTVTGVQRPRQKQWVKELRNGLSAHFSALVTNSILYFNIFLQISGKITFY